MSIIKIEGLITFITIICLCLFSIISTAFALSLAPPEFNTIWSLAFKKTTINDAADSNYIVYIHKESLVPTPDGAIATFLIDYNSAQKSRTTFLFDFKQLPKPKVIKEEIEFRSAMVEIQVDCSWDRQRIFDKRLFSEKLGEGVWANHGEVINPEWNSYIENDVIPNRDLFTYICETMNYKNKENIKNRKSNPQNP